jgi:hypothetical protein
MNSKTDDEEWVVTPGIKSFKTVSVMDSGFHGGKSRMHERNTEEDNDEWGDLEGSY